MSHTCITVRHCAFIRRYYGVQTLFNLTMTCHISPFLTVSFFAGTMVFTHDLMPESKVSGYEDPFSYPFIVTYAGAALAQIGAAADISGECSQYIKVQ